MKTILGFFKNLLCYLGILVPIILAFIVFFIFNGLTASEEREDFNKYISTENLVQIDWPINFDTTTKTNEYYIVTGDALDKCIEVIDTATVPNKYNKRWLDSKSLGKYPRTVTFHYKNGSTKELVFYSTNANIFKISNNKYGSLRFIDKSLNGTIKSCRINRSIKSSDGTYQDNTVKKDLTYYFGDHYTEPWCGQ